MTALLKLLSKPGCHLCDVARDIISDVLDRLDSENPQIDVRFQEISILSDKQLFDHFHEKIPVVLINDELHCFWRVDAARLESAVREAISC